MWIKIGDSYKQVIGVDCNQGWEGNQYTLLRFLDGTTTEIRPYEAQEIEIKKLIDVLDAKIFCDIKM